MNLGPYFRLIRPVNLLVLVLTQTLVYLTLPESGCLGFALNLRFGLLILCTIFLASAGYVINDYFDAKIDLVNKPEKTVLDTRISRRNAIIVHIILNLVAVLTGFFLSLRLGIFNLGVALALVAYSSSLKKRFLIGNVFVAALMGLVVFVVWLFDRGLNFNGVMLYSGFAFMTGLLREIIKDIEDRKGDAKFGCTTLPIMIGIYRTKKVLFFLGLLFLLFLLAFIGYSYFRINNWLTLYLIVLVLFPAIYFLIALIKADTQKAFQRLSSLLKVIMVLGIGSLLLLCAG